MLYLPLSLILSSFPSLPLSLPHSLFSSCPLLPSRALFSCSPSQSLSPSLPLSLSHPLPPSPFPLSLPLSLLLAPSLPPSADRLKGIAGAALQTGGELADNDIIAAVAEAAANQITADDDATVGERIGMLAGDVTAAVVDSGLIENEQALTVIEAVGDVVKEQAEMDPDASAGTRRHALTF